MIMFFVPSVLLMTIRFFLDDIFTARVWDTGSRCEFDDGQPALPEISFRSDCVRVAHVQVQEVSEKHCLS